MALVLVLGGGSGWGVHRVRVQRDVVVAIERAGGYVYYEEWLNAPPWLRWLVARLGPDYFVNVRQVQLGSFPRENLTITDELMADVGRLSHLEFLNVHGTKRVTDAGLSHLRGLSGLRSLHLTYTGVKGLAW